MRSLFNTILGYFLTPPGLVLMAALDSSLIFFLPLGIDFAIIVVTARDPDLFWLHALLGTIGSVAGAMVTFWIGRKVGEHGLKRLLPPRRFERVKERVSGSAAVSIAALGVIPPPFPFTAFILASGALGAGAVTFAASLAGVRLMRFMVEAWLAATFGSRILEWMASTIFEVAVGVLIVLAIGGTIASAVAVYRGTRSADGRSETLR